LGYPQVQHKAHHHSHPNCMHADLDINISFDHQRS
jgi:hypothetical protein